MNGDVHILCVDDEVDVRDMLQEYLIGQGFAVSTAANTAEARLQLAARAAALVLLDLKMPGEDGLSFARELRGSGTAIIMLTASSATIDRVVGLEVGADDYVAKPFDPRELLARIRSVLRRTQATPGPESCNSPPSVRLGVRVGRCLFDREARRLCTSDGAEVPITAMEFDLLDALVERPNRVLSRDQLLDLANRRGHDPFDRSIDIRVARLRQKIEEHPDKPQAIRTVRGVGYMFVPAGSQHEN